MRIVAGLRKDAQQESPWRSVEKKYPVDLAENDSKARRRVEGWKMEGNPVLWR
jgi:hypothetical protein